MLPSSTLFFHTFPLPSEKTFRKTSTRGSGGKKFGKGWSKLISASGQRNSSRFCLRVATKRLRPRFSSKVRIGSGANCPEGDCINCNCRSLFEQPRVSNKLTTLRRDTIFTGLKRERGGGGEGRNFGQRGGKLLYYFTEREIFAKNFWNFRWLDG